VPESPSPSNLLEALAIVPAVAVSRRWKDALIGAAGAVVVCALLAVLSGRSSGSPCR
jgi:uncharacterized membrane protein